MEQINKIHALRKLEIKLDVSGTATQVGNTKLYKDSFGFVLLQVYVPVTQQSVGKPLCTVHRIVVDERGNRKIFNQEKFNLLFVDKVEHDNKEYLLFESPLPKQFTDTVGTLDLVFNYTEVNNDGKVTARLSSNLYHTSVDYGGIEGGDIELSLMSQEAAQINANTIAIESLKSSVDDLLQSPDISEADNVGVAKVELMDDGRLKFIELKGEKGDTGEKGKSFGISKTYTSVESMNDGYANDKVEQGQFVVVRSEPGIFKTAKLYLKGEIYYDFITDLSIGPKGENGERGEIGEIGPKGADGIGAENAITFLPQTLTESQKLQARTNIEAKSSSYDIIIKTQEEFDEMINSYSWLGAKSVLFVGNGGGTRFTYSVKKNAGIKIPINVKQIQGINNAIIVVTNYISPTSDGVTAALYYNEPITNDYSISELTVRCSNMENFTSDAFCFRNCTNLTNCTSDGFMGGVSGNTHGYCNCTNLVNCIDTGKGNFAHGFENCSNLVNCVSVGGAKSLNYGFSQCTQLANCSSPCFIRCNQLANCNCKGSESSSYCNCTDLVNCIDTSESEYAHSFYKCTQLTNCEGSCISNKGYGFYDCSYLNCCTSTKTTNIWGGTTIKRDDNTCKIS